MEPQVIKMTPWHGGECPVPEGAPGIITSRNGRTRYTTDLAGWTWDHGLSFDGDIVKYAVIKIETEKPALRDLRGWVLDGNGVPWWASEKGLHRTSIDPVRITWEAIEKIIAHDDDRITEQLRPMTPADLEVKELPAKTGLE